MFSARAVARRRRFGRQTWICERRPEKGALSTSPAPRLTQPAGNRLALRPMSTARVGGGFSVVGYVVGLWEHESFASWSAGLPGLEEEMRERTKKMRLRIGRSLDYSLLGCCFTNSHNTLFLSCVYVNPIHNIWYFTLRFWWNKPIMN